jgi:hypothetical protein
VSPTLKWLRQQSSDPLGVALKVLKQMIAQDSSTSSTIYTALEDDVLKSSSHSSELDVTYLLGVLYLDQPLHSHRGVAYLVNAALNDHKESIEKLSCHICKYRHIPRIGCVVQSASDVSTNKTKASPLRCEEDVATCNQ